MSKRKTIFTIILLLFCFHSAVWGLTYWKSEWNDPNKIMPPLPGAMGTPDPNCFARLYSASGNRTPFTIISSNCVMTAKHWPYNFINKTLIVGTDYNNPDYKIIQEWNCPNADLSIYKVEKISDPNAEPFSTWVDPYNNDDVYHKEVTICSYGPLRTKDDETYQISYVEYPPTYEYHWGKNITDVGMGSVQIWFDKVGQGNYVEYEAYGQSGDSGSGWLIYDDYHDEWKIASLFTSAITGPIIPKQLDWIYDCLELAGGPAKDPATVVNLNSGYIYCSIQEAIDDACDFDVIEAGPRTYYENINFGGKPVTVQSTNPDNWDVVANTIIDANGTGVAVLFNSGEDTNSILRGLTITGASTGISCGPGNSPVIADCNVTGNTTGILSYNGSPSISHCKISDNIYGVIGVYDSASIKNNWIYDNSRGIYFVSTSTADVINNTIVYNNYGIDVGYGSPAPTISNCILWGNGEDLDDSLSATYCCISDGDAGEGNIISDPCFVDDVNNDFHLTLDSDCINAGDDSYIPDEGETDFDGDTRRLGGIVDMGADEVIRVHNTTKDEWYWYIHEAIDQASNGNVIVAYPDVYEENVDFDGKAVIVRSTDPDSWETVAETIIDAQSGAYTVAFQSGEDANSVLTGFTVTSSAHLYLGAVHTYGSSPTINRCMIRDNSGIGIRMGYYSTPQIENNKIYNNSTGIFSETSYVASIRNNWIYDNSTGICYVQAPVGEVINNTIVNNTSDGVHCRPGLPPEVDIRNCILWGNGDDLDNCSATYSCIEDGDDGEGNISEDPLFVDDANDDYHLDINSPCINAGDPNGDYTGQVDIDGGLRVVMYIVDMGGDERHGVHNTTKDIWYMKIQDAIDEAEHGDEIVVYPGEYYEDINFLGKTITVRSTDPNDWGVVADTIIDADGAPYTAAFQNAEDANSVLTGFTITGSVYLGGISTSNSSPAVSRCIIRGNNSGIRMGYYSAPIIENNKIFDNGTGILSETSYVARIASNWIYDNSTGISYVQALVGEVINNTIVNNTSGISCRPGPPPALDIRNCIFWYNGTDLSGCTATYSCYSGGMGTNIDDDPEFVDANNNDYHLKLSSPCIDAGDPNYITYDGEEDIDGNARLIGEFVDMGGDEAARVHNIIKDIWYWYIQDAIDEASNGDEIVAYPDEYQENVDFDGKAITIRGTDPYDWDVVADTIIDAQSGVYTVAFQSGEDANSVLTGLTVTSSTSLYLGAVLTNGSSPIIDRCIVRDNNLGVRMGYYSNPLIKNNKIFNNGTGILSETNYVTSIVNNWIYDNSTGISYVQALVGEVTNNTIAYNTSTGISCRPGPPPEVDITNCILWDNSNDLYNCSATYSCIEDGDSGPGNIYTDPNFVDANSSDYRLTTGSGCIDAANGDVAPETDIFDQIRIDDPNMPNTGVGDPNYVDIGACEYQPE